MAEKEAKARKKAVEIAFPDSKDATAKDRVYMKRANQIAINAMKNGNHPFGALLVYNDTIIMECENQVVTTKDLTLHAETGLVAKATRNLTPEIIAKSTLYTSTEPCIMCCGALFWAKVKKIVYGVTSKQFEALLDDGFNATNVHDIFKQIGPQVEIVGPLLEKEGLLIHAGFWFKRTENEAK